MISVLCQGIWLEQTESIWVIKWSNPSNTFVLEQMWPLRNWPSITDKRKEQNCENSKHLEHLTLISLRPPFFQIILNWTMDNFKLSHCGRGHKILLEMKLCVLNCGTELVVFNWKWLRVNYSHLTSSVIPRSFHFKYLRIRIHCV